MRRNDSGQGSKALAGKVRPAVVMASCQHKLPQNAEADHRDIAPPDKAVRRDGGSRFIPQASRRGQKNHEIGGASALVAQRSGFGVLSGVGRRQGFERRGLARIREGFNVVLISMIRR